MRSAVPLILVMLAVSSAAMPEGYAMARPCGDVSARTLGDFDVPGVHAVGVRTLTFVDASRPTPPNGSFPGAPARTLVTEIWYPAAQAGRDGAVDSGAGPYPVVIYSHGANGTRFDGEVVGPHLASRGMIVAAPQYPLLHSGAPGGITTLDFPNQPADWSFVLDAVLAEFGPAADPGRVGATGFSMGGLTTLLVTYHRRLRDPRIQAALPMAPSACFLTRRFFREVQTPLLIMHGDGDPLASFRGDGRRAYAGARSPRFLARLENGSHLGFAPIAAVLDPAVHYDQILCALVTATIGGPFDPLQAFANLADPDVGIELSPRRCRLGCVDPLPGSPAMPAVRHHQLTRVTQAAFFEAYLRGDDAARCFLRRALGREADVGVNSAGAGRPSPVTAP